MKIHIARREIKSLSFSSQISPLLQRIYTARGVETEKELALSLDHLLPYHSLLHIEKAADLLAQAIFEKKSILIVGDFDADGATGTALLTRALTLFGAHTVNYLVPNRFDFGYGLTPELVAFACEQQKPNLIMTVDNGIANHAGVMAAKEKNITVIITDHHLPNDTLPIADAIVNPNQPNDSFPSKCIAGVGVAFYVMLALRQHLQEKKWFEKNNRSLPNMAVLLDLVALGTVADIVPLDHNNRILVHQGLQRIRARACVPGILALLAVAKRNPPSLMASDLGFAVAPRLNAAGRLEDMSIGIECLLTDDKLKAASLAEKLDALNIERRAIEETMQQQAFKDFTAIHLDSHTLPVGICLFNKNWHQGVIGILAARVKERFHRPVIAFACADPLTLKGSARSISGLHIRDILALIDAQYPGLIIKFGGHAMAAGLTLSIEQFEKFSAVFNAVVTSQLNPNALEHCLYSDGALTEKELTVSVADALRAAGPWGQGFPEPLFDGHFKLLEQRIVGTKHLKLVLGLGSKSVDAIAFNIDLSCWPNHRCDTINIVYRLDINEYRDRRNLQLIVEHLEVSNEMCEA